MHTYIKVRTQFEGYHCWKDAPEDVAFLRDLHRHLFGVVVLISVDHLNRALEFFQVRKVIDGIIKSMKSALGKEASCEMMARYIQGNLKEYYGWDRIISVETNEDGENGAIVT